MRSPDSVMSSFVAVVRRTRENFILRDNRHKNGIQPSPIHILWCYKHGEDIKSLIWKVSYCYRYISDEIMEIFLYSAQAGHVC